MIVSKFSDITTMWNTITNSALWNPDEVIDFTIKGSRIVSSDNFIRCRSCHFDFNLASVGFTQGTWDRFLTKYFEPGQIRDWLNSTRNQTAGVDNYLRTKNPGHRWGPCFLGISFRSHPYPRLVLYSRTAIMPTAATLELSFCSVIERELEKPVKFLWISGSIWWSSLKLLPYLKYKRELRKFMNYDTFLSKAVKNDYEGIKSGRQTWAGRKRTLALAMNVKNLPNLQVSNLQIEKGVE